MCRSDLFELDIYQCSPGFPSCGGPLDFSGLGVGSLAEDLRQSLAERCQNGEGETGETWRCSQWTIVIYCHYCHHFSGGHFYLSHFWQENAVGKLWCKSRLHVLSSLRPLVNLCPGAQSRSRVASCYAPHQGSCNGYVTVVTWKSWDPLTAILHSFPGYPCPFGGISGRQCFSQLQWPVVNSSLSRVCLCTSTQCQDL